MCNIDSCPVPGGPDKRLIPFCRNADSGSQSQLDNLILHGEEMDAGIEQNNVELTMEGCCTRPPSTAAAALTSCPRRTAVPRHLSHALRPYDRHSLTAEAAGLQRRCGNA